MKIHRFALAAVCAWAVTGFVSEKAFANSIVVTNVALTNASGGTAQIQLDLSWSNSWRTVWTDDGGFTFVTNWDAAWIFAKVRVSGGDWKPVWFTTSGHTVPVGTAVTVAQNGGVTNPGVFLYRSAEGAGGVNYPTVLLQWDYIASGLFGTNQVDLAVFATEMVYTPEGAFYLGTGGSEAGTFLTFTNRSSPFRITNEAAMAIGPLTGALNVALAPSGYGGSMSGTLSNAFPKGYAAFYAMKYEISQGQYADFLNHLQPGIAAARFASTTLGRHTITYNGTNYVAGAPDRACNYLNWDDVCVFLDWAGLRPLTEMEYEKMCRGFKAPALNELAFGDINPTFVTSITGVDGSGTETASNANANVCGNAFFTGPVRVGMFATATSDRTKSGAGYFGAMDLSGNVYEHLVFAGDARGRSFAGTHGDGNVSLQPSDWPTVAVGTGYGMRGGSSVDTSLSYFHVSDRSFSGFPSSRTAATGGRGGRNAP